MAFHVDGDSASLQVQRGLAGLSRDYFFNSGKPALDHPPPSKTGAGDQFLAQREASQPARIAGQDLGRHHDIARFQGRTEAAGDAETDDATDGRWIECSQQGTQLLWIAAAADDRHAWAGRDAGFLHKT